MTGELKGKRILVTGGATGIGAAAVQVLHAAGASVAATFHHTAPPAHSDLTWLQCDATDPASVDETTRAAADALHGLDVLVHAAGLWHPGVPGQLGINDIRHVMDTNFTSTVLTNQAAAAAMGPAGGRIINFGSSEGVMGSPMSAIYAASKSAVASWTRSAAKCWASQGITVNALAPAVETPGAQRLRDFLGPDLMPVIEQQLQMSIPIGGKLGDPVSDVGPMLVFLAGDGSRFITGQLLAVDGGLMMLGA
ncbi:MULTISPECIES: SDR family NAD(P)-dependent oxidoreductase [unclassified Mycobacterium]|uniref:SDR family NAD(P)-dependent oxidoreductase n=1 Tax=unclassified Mycobacterium TaxID=2642494 RepID=UPI0029C768EB|nr:MULTISPECIES: SDR family oxidoreductase [unclassified Mycobacterium]